MAQINFGDKGGVIVHDDLQNGRVLVEVSRFHQQVQRQFKGRTATGFYSSYENNPPFEPQDNNVMLAIPAENIQSEDQIKEFNRRVSGAARIHQKIAQDFQDIHDVVRFDHTVDDRKIISRYGQDKAKDADGNTYLKSWAYGEVIGRNESYVAFASGENNDARFIRILPIEKFISREDDKDNLNNILNKRLAQGSYKKLTWNDDKSITVEDAQKVVRSTQRDEQKEVATEQAETTPKPSRSRAKPKETQLAA
ncbi:hypothetical protein ACTJNK_13695 [Achromobacter anxifer]